jgi:hypothetical protein
MSRARSQPPPALPASLPRPYLCRSRRPSWSKLPYAQSGSCCRPPRAVEDIAAHQRHTRERAARVDLAVSDNWGPASRVGSPPQAVAAGGGQLQIAADTADGVSESLDGGTTSTDALTD